LLNLLVPLAIAQADRVIGCLPEQLDVLSRVYRLCTPHDVIAPGVAPVFFEAGDGLPDPAIPARFGLEPGRYLTVTARLSETKNIPGAVALLGEARALAPARFGSIALAVVGGNPEPREPEELAVEAKIAAMMARYGLHGRDVQRVPAQTWPVVAQLLRQSLCYVGMQHFEPFGMGAAEALAVFESLEAPLWATKARADLARIGGRRSAGEGLTPTERRIAELVAEGNTNKEVAAVLVVAERTVESALTQIYRKLDVRSRTELARKLAG
jgi:DNA-binding CsgD family transcriptional regulator